MERSRAGERAQRAGGVPGRRAGFHRTRLNLQGGTNLADRNREGDLFVQGGLGLDLGAESLPIPDPLEALESIDPIAP